MAVKFRVCNFLNLPLDTVVSKNSSCIKKTISIIAIGLLSIFSLGIYACHACRYFKNRKVEQIPNKNSKVDQVFKKNFSSDPKDVETEESKRIKRDSTRLLFQLGADEFGKHSSLEGSSQQNVLACVLNYTQEHPSLCNEQQELIRVLGVAHKIASSSNMKETLRTAIQEAFETKKPILIPGGWEGKPSGHAIYYELIPEDGRKATLRIFNTGEGIQEHDRFQVGVKDKVRYAEWQGIRSEKLLDPHFSLAIEELNTQVFLKDSESERTEYSFRDIYYGLRDFLEVKVENRINEESALNASLMQPQRAGTCSFRSLLAFIKTRMEANEFRRFKCDIRIQALAANALLPLSKGKPNKKELSERARWRLIKKSLQNVSRKVNDLYNDRIVTAAYLEQAQNTLKPVADWIEKHRDPLLGAKSITVKSVHQKPGNKFFLFSPSESLDIPKNLGDEKVAINATSGIACSHLMENIKKYTFKDPATFIQNIREVRSLIEQAHKKGEYSAVIYAVVALAKKFDILDTFWKKVSGTKDELKKAAEDLNSIADSFFTSCYRISPPDCIFPEQVYAIQKLLHTQNALITRVYPEITLCFTKRVDKKDSLFFQPQDEQIEWELKMMKENGRERGGLFSSFVKADTASVEIRERWSDIIGDQLNDIVQQYHPHVIETIIKENSSYTNSSREMQRLLLYTSPHLPSWLKNLRDSRLRLNFLMKARVIPPENENASLQFQFKIEDEEVKTSLDGINRESFNILPDKERKKNRDYAATQRNMLTKPMQKLEQFLEKRWESYAQYNEKSLVAEKMRDKIPEFSEEKAKELIHPFLSQKSEFRLTEIVEYFSRYPERLKEPDFQQIFQGALFGFFENPISGHHKIVPILINFLTKQLNNYLGQNEIGTSVFLIRINRYLGHFHKFEDSPIKGTALIKELLKNKGLSPEETSLLYAERIGHLGEKEVLSDEELTDFLLATIWLQNIRLPEKWHEPKYLWERQKALLTHSKAIEELIAPGGVANELLIKKLYEKSRGIESKADWHCAYVAGEAPRLVSTAGDVYDPLQERLFALNKETYLPSDIRDTVDFRRLFPNQTRALALPGNIYQFSDGSGHSILVKKVQNELIIEQERNGRKYIYVPPHTLVEESKDRISSALESRHLIDKFSHWFPLDNSLELLIIERESNRERYKVQLTNKSKILEMHVEKIIRISDNALLGKPSQIFTHFEAPAYIQEWYDDQGNLIEIELPRFALSFKPHKENNERLECTQYPGWCLATDQLVPALGGCNYYLLLIGPNGKKKVLLPNQELKAPKKKEVIEPHFKRKQELEIGNTVSFDHYIYEVDAKGQLKTSSREANLFLVETLATHQEYELATTYLRQHGEKLSAYSPPEIVHLERIYKIKEVTGDESGEQYAIGLYAAYLLATNPIHSKEAKKDLSGFYRNYLDHFHNITALHLTKEEELRLLKNLLSEESEPHFKIRLLELDPDYARKLQNIDKTLKNTKVSSDTVKNTLKNMQLPYIKNKSYKKLLTRGAACVKESIFDFVTEAIQGTPEQKKWLQDAAIFFRSHASKETRALGILFKEILENPSHFTLPPTGSNVYEEQVNWWSRTVDKLDNMNLEAVSSSDLILPNITRPNYRLEKDRALLPLIPFSLDVKKLSSLGENVDTSTLNKIRAAIIDGDIKKENQELDQWLNKQKNAVSAKDDPLQALEWQRLAEDSAFHQNHSTTMGVNLKASAQIPVVEIQAFLKRQSASDLSKIKELETSLLQLANRLPQDRLAKIQHELQRWGGIKKNVTLEDIFISLAQKEPKTLQALNSNLDQQSIHQLYSMAALYLQLTSKSQQCERCLETCKKIENLKKSASVTKKQELEKQLLSDLLAKREYAPNAHPAYLVFEYYAGILMRKDQITKLEDFLSGKTANPIMEMIMGSGKSKVLLPLLALMRANGQALSMLVVPSPLFESISSDTQKILKGAFAKALRTLHFDRNTTFTKRSLEEIRDILKEVIENKECLIMTSKSIQSLLLKFIEQADHSFQNNEFLSDEFLLMQEIIGLLNKCGNPLIDEADTVLNILHEVSFSLGKKYNPQATEIQLIGEIYHLLYTDPKLKAIAQLESDRRPNLKAPALTEDSYYKTLQQPLAAAILERLKTASLGNNRLEDQLYQFLKALPSKERKLLLDYLCRNKSTIQEAQSFVKTLPEDLQDVFALLGEEISHLLPHSLTRISDQNYGLDGDVLAIPYKASKIPNTGSLFSNPYITMNYTYQIHFKNRISKKIIEDQMAKLQQRALIEIDESGGTMSVNDTQAWEAFCVLKGDSPIPLFNYTDTQIDALEKRVNSSPKIQEEIIAKIFLPQLELFDQKLSCNPIGFSSLFAKLSGFTGTLWNAHSMHRKLTPMAEQGTDAKTLNLLWNMGKDNVHIIPKASVDKMLDVIKSKGISFDLISDAGGYFKEGDNLFIARRLALKLGKPVVFYNSKGEQTVTNGNEEHSLATSVLSEEERLTFLDQSHTTGADVKQRLEAVGLVTIGRNMLLRDLLQSVWRLRGLERGQKIQFIMDEEVESIIRHSLQLNPNEKIGFPEILKFVIVNQSKQQGNDNFKSFKNQVWNLPQSLLIDALLSKDIPSKIAYELLIETWIKQTHLSATALYGSPAIERPSAIVITEESKKCKAFLQRIEQELPLLKEKIDACLNEIDQLSLLTANRVHPMITSPIADDSETVEIEQEAEVAVEIETQVVSEDEKARLGTNTGGITEVDDLTAELFASDYNYLLPFFPLEKQMEREPSLREFAPLFKDIIISTNILEWKDDEKDYTKCQLLGPHRTPFHYLNVDNDKVSLFSFSEVEQGDGGANYNLYIGFTKRKDELTNAAFEKITKLKFLNGESTYNKKEIEFLEKWIREAGHEKMKRLFGMILNNQPDKAVAFAGSSLYKIFGHKP